jgi:molybdopterin-containing oxidoreductase family iron-sulfur binding subunit
MNDALGNAGRTLVYTAPVETTPRPPQPAAPSDPLDPTASLRALVADMDAGRVDTLVILDANPVYTAPADLRFADALGRVRLRVHLGLYDDETAALCHWHIPQAHALESWGDARAFDGTATIIQPLIAPLYGGRSAHEVLAALLEQPNRTSHDIVREYWRGQAGGGDFELFWRRALHDGVVEGTALAPKQVTLRREYGRIAIRPFAAQPAAGPPGGSGELELVFRPDPTIWDGRFANNGWLQELPKPLTKLTWDNAALVSPATARRLGLASEEVVELRFRGVAVRAPVWIAPGQPDDSVTVTLGYGRTRAGRVGNGLGFNAYALRATDAFWFGPGLEIRKTGARHPLATTQQHFSMEGREHVRATTLDEFRRNPDFAREGETGEQRSLPTLYPEYRYDGYAWGMAIDLNACIGCNACTIACQAENNIPVVGKEQVAIGREMHWIRVDRYYAGAAGEGDAGLANPETYFQPVPCMHCEKAPCEVVCPVAATTHDAEGLNVMVYNRCVGTRYCSNNCPYKVRRFNFLQYADKDTESLKLQRNPQVTVRNRGVMEKCTYCTQRIEAARIAAEREGRAIRDGELLTACQQACPTGAIVFGDVNDPDSQVTRLKAGPLNYGLLAELGTQPRTTYLARLRNPNPELGTA